MTFGKEGKLTISEDGLKPRDLLIESDSLIKILFAKFSTNQTVESNQIYQIKNGQIDKSFKNNGVFIINTNVGYNVFLYQSNNINNGYYLIVLDSESDLVISNYNNNLKLNKSFGENGIFIQPIYEYSVGKSHCFFENNNLLTIYLSSYDVKSILSINLINGKLNEKIGEGGISNIAVPTYLSRGVFISPIKNNSFVINISEVKYGAFIEYTADGKLNNEIGENGLFKAKLNNLWGAFSKIQHFHFIDNSYFLLGFVSIKNKETPFIQKYKL